MKAEALAEFLKGRLVSEQAKSDWAQMLQEGWAHFAASDTDRFLGPELEALVEAHRDEAQAVAWVRASVRAVIETGLAQARSETGSLEQWIPAEAEATLMKIVSREGLIDRRWVEHLFAQKAMEEVVTDTLYRALKDFSTIVPRIVQSMTPSAIGKLAKLGGRATGGVGSKLVDEVEKRLEQEIKKWLDKGSRRALDGAARFTIEHLDDPVSIEARKNTVKFALTQSPAFHVRQIDDQMLRALETAACDIARRVVQEGRSLEISEEVLRKIRAEAQGQTVEQWLAGKGFDVEPALSAWAEVTWPYLKAFIESPAVHAFIDQIAHEGVEFLEARSDP